MVCKFVDVFDSQSGINISALSQVIGSRSLAIGQADAAGCLRWYLLYGTLLSSLRPKRASRCAPGRSDDKALLTSLIMHPIADHKPNQREFPATEGPQFGAFGFLLTNHGRGGAAPRAALPKQHYGRGGSDDTAASLSSQSERGRQLSIQTQRSVVPSHAAALGEPPRCFGCSPRPRAHPPR